MQHLTSTMMSLELLSLRSVHLVIYIIVTHQNVWKYEILQGLKGEAKDEYLRFLRATIKCLTSPERYYEKTVRHAIKGVGTDEKALTRVVVTQAEVNMQRIKEEYHKRNSTPLEHAISGDTSSDYKKILLALVSNEEVWDACVCSSYILWIMICHHVLCLRFLNRTIYCFQLFQWLNCYSILYYWSLLICTSLVIHTNQGCENWTRENDTKNL